MAANSLVVLLDRDSALERGHADPVVIVVETRPGDLEDACIAALTWREKPGAVDLATLRSGGIEPTGKFVRLIVAVDESDP